MGVAASGKTTVGMKAADVMRWPFPEGIRCTSAAKVEKMSHENPSTDIDRAPWPAAIHARLLDSLRRGERVVVGCSAPKQSCRTVLAEGIPIPGCISKTLPTLIRSRLQQRTGHCMKVDMLASQFEASEEPSDVLIVDVSQPHAAIVEQILTELREPPRVDTGGSPNRRKAGA
jgi:gluconokinase